jgi:hypothetical protein
MLARRLSALGLLLLGCTPPSLSSDTSPAAFPSSSALPSSSAPASSPSAALSPSASSLLASSSAPLFPAPSSSASSPSASSSAAARPPAGSSPLAALHTPLTAATVARLRGLLKRSGGRVEVFAKVGDSITVSGAFLRCFDGDDLRWGEHGGLKETRDFFARTRVDERATSFGRDTLAAKVGWRTEKVLKGMRPPLLRELDALRPAWAVVMLGTNDTFPDGMQGYAQALRTVVDTLLERGVVPLLSTIPPRRDSLRARELTEEMNAVVRMVARSRQIPLMDLFRAMDDLPHGGVGGDGVHPEPLREDRMHPCWFNAQGLTAGMNVRNLLVLDALDRVRRKVLGDEAPDPDPPASEGDGAWATPVLLALPGVHDGDTRGGPMQATTYRCNKEKFPGPERVFRVDVARPGKVRVRLFSEGKSKLALRWLSSPDPDRCEARARARLDVNVTPGPRWLVVESTSEAEAGRFGLTLLPR